MNGQHRVLVWTDDLLSLQQLDPPARCRKLLVMQVQDAEQLMAELEEATQVDAVVVDLKGVSIESLRRLVPRVRQLAPSLPIIAFGPHVHRDKLHAAAEAGCDHVWTQGHLRAHWQQWCLARHPA